MRRYPINLDSISYEISGRVREFNEMNTLWEFPESESDTKDDRIFGAITNHLRYCTNYLSKHFTKVDNSTVQLKSLAKIPFKNVQEKLFHAMAGLLQEIMGNYTYRYYDYKICVKGQIFEKTVKNWDLVLTTNLLVQGESSKYSMYRLLTLPEEVTNLRFVSCGGDRGKQFIPFSELFSVYNIYVWCCIIFSSIALAWTIARIPKTRVSNSKNNNCFFGIHKYLFGIYKVMVEQGDPFISSVTTTLNLRYAVGSFLLVGIVLSNAYKSENVYNMIKLRKSIPYEKFQELVDNNFTIYSRASYLHFDGTALNHEVTRSGLKRGNNSAAWFNLTTVNPHYLTYHPAHPYMMSITSEIYEWTQASKFINTTSALLSKIMNYTKLHPDIESIMKLSFDELIEFLKWHSWDITYKRKEVWHLEQEHLEKFLVACNRAALVVPEILANEFGKELQRNGTQNVYVGKESYSDISLSLILSGYVQQNALKRMKFIKESGMWDWWPKFFRNSKQFALKETNKNVESEKPNMSGNIVTLFLMLVYGLTTASGVFIFEVRVRIQNFLLICFKSVVRVASITIPCFKTILTKILNGKVTQTSSCFQSDNSQCLDIFQT